MEPVARKMHAAPSKNLTEIVCVYYEQMNCHATQ